MAAQYKQFNFNVMRKKYYLMALTGLLLASCSEENDPFGPDGGQVPVSGRELTFVFPGTAQGVVPYAVTALPAENELKTLDIYVFGEDSMQAAKPMLLEEIYRSGVAGDGSAGDSKGYTLSTSGSDKTAKISVPAGNNKAFFFVANAREHLSLDSVELHVTDTATFKSKLSNTLKGLIACPMLMSGQKDLPDVATAIAGGAAVDIELARRVARFDIKNNSETSNFVVTKVALANVPGNVPEKRLCSSVCRENAADRFLGAGELECRCHQQRLLPVSGRYDHRKGSGFLPGRDEPGHQCPTGARCGIQRV